MLLTAGIAHRLLIATAACLFLVFAACARTEAGIPAETQRILTADEVLARSREAVAEIESYRFTGEWMLGTSAQGQRWIRSGEWTAPDRYRLKFEGVDQTAGQGQELLVIGDLGYFRQLF